MACTFEMLVDSESSWRWRRLLLNHYQFDLFWKQRVSQPSSVDRLFRGRALAAVVLVLVIEKVSDLLSLYVVL
jgi:hypothetical protein